MEFNDTCSKNEPVSVMQSAYGWENIHLQMTSGQANYEMGQTCQKQLVKLDLAYRTKIYRKQYMTVQWKFKAEQRMPRQHS